MNSFNEVSAHLIGFENEVSALFGRGRMLELQRLVIQLQSWISVQETNLIRNNAWRLACSHLEQPLVEIF